MSYHELYDIYDRFDKLPLQTKDRQDHGFLRYLSPVKFSWRLVHNNRDISKAISHEFIVSETCDRYIIKVSKAKSGGYARLLLKQIRGTVPKYFGLHIVVRYAGQMNTFSWKYFNENCKVDLPCCYNLKMVQSQGLLQVVFTFINFEEVPTDLLTVSCYDSLEENERELNESFKRMEHDDRFTHVERYILTIITETNESEELDDSLAKSKSEDINFNDMLNDMNKLMEKSEKKLEDISRKLKTMEDYIYAFRKKSEAINEAFVAMKERKEFIDSYWRTKHENVYAVRKEAVKTEEKKENKELLDDNRKTKHENADTIRKELEKLKEKNEKKELIDSYTKTKHKNVDTIRKEPVNLKEKKKNKESIESCTQTNEDTIKKETVEKKGSVSSKVNFKNLFLNEKVADVFFKVENQNYPAHKKVVAARSSVLQEMFNNDANGNNQIVVINDCDPKVFHDILLYMYTGNLDGISNDNILELYHMSEKYNIIHLQIDCVYYILNVFNTKVISDMYYEKIHCKPELLTPASRYFVDNIYEILKKRERCKVLYNKKPDALKKYFLKLKEASEQ